MEHCHWNMSKIIGLYARRNVETSSQVQYEAFLTHAAACTNCSRKLRDLQEAEELERRRPRPAKLPFGRKVVHR